MRGAPYQLVFFTGPVSYPFTPPCSHRSDRQIAAAARDPRIGPIADRGRSPRASLAGLDIIGSFKDCVDATDGDGGLCIPKAVFKASTRLPGLIERLTLGYRALTETAGIEMPEDIEFGEGDGGLRIKMDENERSDEIHIP